MMQRIRLRVIHSKVVTMAAMIVLSGGLPSPSQAQTFDEQRQALSVSLTTQPEARMFAMLEAGLEENKPTQAYALIQRWLRENVADDPMLLYHAGRAAELSGNWSDAATLYRQYLTRADLNHESASDAILGTYTLLINQLDDMESAYLFARTEGNRLARSATARQFDAWFLEEAMRRDDRQAVAARLLALVEADVSDDLLVSLYGRYFNWLLDSISQTRFDQRRLRPQLIETVKALAAGIAFDDQLKRLLDWEISVKDYTFSKLAGEQASPPIVQAQALLERYPDYALDVQTDWAGGRRGRHYRGDVKLYWPHELEAKLTPVRQAVAKLDPQQQARYHRSLGFNFYDGGPRLMPDEQATIEFVINNPDIVNQKYGPSLRLNRGRISFEDAAKLAPLLKHNPSPVAALYRAVAAAGEARDYDKAMDALLNREAWRLSRRELDGRYADRLWHLLGRPGGNQTRDAAVKRSKEFLKTHQNTFEIKKDDPAKKKLDTFKRLWKDYRSDQPKTPNVYDKLLQTLIITPQAVDLLLKDGSIEANLLLFQALNKGIVGSDDKAWQTYEKSPAISTNTYSNTLLNSARRFYGVSNLNSFQQRHADLYLSHPLEPVLRQELEQQISRNQVNPKLAFAWLNTQFPDDKTQRVSTAKKLMQSPAWKSMPYELKYGLRQWFGPAVMTPSQQELLVQADPNAIYKPLLELPEDADVARTAAALDQVIEKIRASPTRQPVRGLAKLGALDREVLSSPQVLERVITLVGPMRIFETDWNFGQTLIQIAREQRDPKTLHTIAPYLWRITEVHHRSLADMIRFADALSDEQPSLSQALAQMGLQTIARHKRGHTYYDRDVDIPRLKSIRGKAMLAMGLIDIPVAESHPAYDIYRSQAQFVIGNEDSARQLYLDSTAELLPIHRSLSVPYLLWVLQYHIDNRDQAAQEELARALMTWKEQMPSAFTLDQQLALELAYGDIAMQRGLLNEAHQIFSRIRTKPKYQSLFARHQATLRKVLVERVSGDFDAALQTLLELDAEKNPQLTTDAHYARAEVFYAMEEYQDAADEVAKVLEREPDHSDATILLGRVQLKLQRLIEATEVELGSVTDQASIVPGEMLKVTLNDPTLTVSSGATSIEVVVWASSGDREYVLLRQFGDQKTKYRGEVRTALGKPAVDDRTLQIVGDDEIYYAYSERFREKMPDLEENRGGPIIVASDGMLMASARKLLSENEQRIRDMQVATELLETRYRNEAENIAPERLAQIQAEAAERERQRMLEARVKPGSPIYLRVTDPDRGRTDQIDELAVSINASSGDRMGRVVLKETDTHTGQFEGQVNTTEAQALAFASSSQAGLNPNMVISPRTDYPAWRPIAQQNALHEFTVDLNAMASLGSLEIDASEPGYQLKRFLVQTAMNPRRWTTVATYPTSLRQIQNPWQPSVTVVNEAGRRAHYGARSVYSLAELREHLELGWLAAADMAWAKNVSGPSEALPKAALEDVKWRRSGRWENPAVVVRFEAYFYEPLPVDRRFELKLGRHDYEPKDKNQAQPAEFLIAVDGKVMTSKDDKKLEGQVTLNPGLHKLEIWATGWIKSIGFGRQVTLLSNIDDPDRMTPVANSFFDPASFPPGVLEERNAPATIEALNGGKQFEVDFAADSNARMIRLLFLEQEGPVPALRRLLLTDPSGQSMLPVSQDYAELRKNDVLEIITGDRVTVRYVDDRYVTKGQQNHERFLNVSYTDGEIEFADIEPRFSQRHQEIRPYYERLLRFVVDKPLPIVVRDADMDVTPEPDTLTVSVTNNLDERRTLTATETGPSTGIFRAMITPIATATNAADQIRVTENGSLTASYHDKQNLRPGVAYDRVVTLKHAPLAAPQIEIAHATVSPLDPQMHGPVSAEPLNIDLDLPGWQLELQAKRDQYNDLIKPRYLIEQTYMTEQQAPEGGLDVVHGRKALVDIVAPHLALGTASTVDVFVQSDSGRRGAGLSPDSDEFNINVPGTIRTTAILGKRADQRTPERGGYVTRLTQQLGNDYQRVDRSYKQGRFQLSLPLYTGPLAERSFAALTRDEMRDLQVKMPHGLVSRTGERIHIGVPYTDAAGQRAWATTSARVITRPMLDVMAEDYRDRKTEAHIGERVYIRVVDLAADRTPERDQIRVFMASKAGAKHHVILDETAGNTGVFRGSVQLTYANTDDQQTADPETYDVRRQGFPTVYDDTVGVRYTDASDRQTPAQFVKIAKGSDGTIVPFSKQYTDDETAMQTQFAMAESYLEMARRRRALGQEEQAQREFTRARQLLASAITRFRDPVTRAHAEYLLGNLTMEDAEGTTDRQLQEDRYHAALARYMKVTGNYPDTEFASKAQFQTAVIYERLNEPDIAAQEYVKLAYKYPESEHLATAMARLGTHFQRKAVIFERQANALLEQTDDKDAQFEGQARLALAKQEYIKAAQIFERLQERFPSHRLAGTAGLRAGQLYMRAQDYRDALHALMAVVNNESYDGATLRSEAMYWAGRCQQFLREPMLAYALYKRITYDFPESKWAAYARAQLSEEAMLRLDEQLEIERLEAGR